VRRRALCLTAGLAAFAQAAGAADGAALEVNAYLAEGFRIAGKESETRAEPGAPPYEHLTRHLLITTYTLERADERVTCVQTYDSQRETLKTDCD